MALGDSFCFSMAPYPDAVQTLVERELARSCGRDLDLLNAGIAAVGLWEYRTLLDFLLPLWEPDAVVLHLYLGNDGPDLFKHRNDLPFHEEPVFHSAFLTYVRNAVKILRSRERIPAGPPPPRRGHQNQAGKKGGEIVDPALPPATDQDPAFSGPLFSAEAFRKIMADEFGRFYVPEEGLERDWQPHIRLLEEMQRAAEGAGVRFLVVLYPSQLQVYPEYRREMFDAVASLRGYRSLTADRINPSLPNRYLLDWCARSGADCFDLTPVPVPRGAEGVPAALHREGSALEHPRQPAGGCGGERFSRERIVPPERRWSRAGSEVIRRHRRAGTPFPEARARFPGQGAENGPSRVFQRPVKRSADATPLRCGW